MPRSSTASLIERIAGKANITFKNYDSSAIGNNEVFVKHQGELHNLLTQLRASDLKITQRKIKSSSKSQQHSPPVTYMHICETKVFSMGVFLLKPGASIPLHDHPGMNGLLKVLFGKVRIKCFDKLDYPLGAENEMQFNPPLLPNQKEALSRSIQRSVGEFTEDSGPCILTPLSDNIHQIDAVEGPAAFLDILAPPYDPDDGRDCHYYKVLQTVSGNGSKNSGQQTQEETWLLKIPQPDDFWCGGEPYPGPEVSFSS